MLFRWTTPNPPRAILSPCIGVCQMGEDGYCNGCHRTLEEIAGWATMLEAERSRLMDQELPRREARRG